MEKSAANEIGFSQFEQASDEIVGTVISATKKWQPSKARKWTPKTPRPLKWSQERLRLHKDTYPSSVSNDGRISVNNVFFDTIKTSVYHIIQVPFQMEFRKYCKFVKSRLPPLRGGIITQHPKGTYLLIKCRDTHTASAICKRVPTSTHLKLGNKGKSAFKLFESLKTGHPIGNTDRYTFIL